MSKSKCVQDKIEMSPIKNGESQWHHLESRGFTCLSLQDDITLSNILSFFLSFEMDSQHTSIKWNNNKAWAPGNGVPPLIIWFGWYTPLYNSLFWHNNILANWRIFVVYCSGGFCSFLCYYRSDNQSFQLNELNKSVIINWQAWKSQEKKLLPLEMRWFCLQRQFRIKTNLKSVHGL